MTEPYNPLLKITARHSELLKDAAVAYARMHGISDIRSSPDMIALFEIDDALALIISANANRVVS